MGRALNVIGVPTGAATFTAALEGLTALDQQILRENPGLPTLYQAGVSYTAKSTPKWRNILDCIESRDGDCEALAPWRAAELRESGEDPRAQVLVYPSGTAKFHAVVLKGDGTIEDPSVLLGMKAPAGLVDNYNWWNREVAPRVADQAPRPTEGVDVLGFDDENVACVGIMEDHAPGLDLVTFDVIRTPDGFRGQFRFPFLDGRALYGVSSTSGTEAEAERKATAVLGFVGSVWDDLEALAPGPQSLAVLHLARNSHVQNLAKAAYGKAKSVVHPGSTSSSSASSSGRPSPADMDAAAARAADRAAASASLDDGTTAEQLGAPSPFDDQQGLADVDNFHRTPPGGLDASLMPDAVAGLDDYEGAVIGWINASLISGSRPARKAPTRSAPTRSAPTRSAARPSTSSSSGMHAAPAPAQSVAFAGYTPPLQSAPPAFSPGGAQSTSAGRGGAGGRSGAGGRGGAAGARGGAGGRGGQQQQQQQRGGQGGQQQRGGGQGGQFGQFGQQQRPGQGGQFPPGDPRNQGGRFPPGDPRDPKNQQQQQQGGGSGSGSGGGGDSGGGGGSGAPQAAQSDTDIDAFFAMGPGGRMGDDAFYNAAQLAQQVDQFEGNAPGDGYAGPDYAGDAAADAFAAEGSGMSDQQFADASAFAQQAYQQEGGG